MSAGIHWNNNTDANNITVTSRHILCIFFLFVHELFIEMFGLWCGGHVFSYRRYGFFLFSQHKPTISIYTFHIYFIFTTNKWHTSNNATTRQRNNNNNKHTLIWCTVHTCIRIEFAIDAFKYITCCYCYHRIHVFYNWWHKFKSSQWLCK